ncbi:MAG: MtnX-like HAD-IB family phosphatase [candidate division Zixibacteria bacterium]|nr:MtnX-like HAD-IB family phosphatase [candidate division Zixibacteria bacterium]MDH3937459.1 MtnX-like HAD-IB family phosphatase [candidate division Zixibacteria bacterium]MDH4032530.1 MtnX-like HAD-IB family phosphatase [candidate division Zixibacteria bacterium]
MKTAIFCDFDGTISRRDIGYNLFHHFSQGRNDELVPLWKKGELTTRECLLKEAAMVHAHSDEIYRYLDQFELNRGFEPFVRLCQANSADLAILSDGLDFYIEYVLKRHRLNHLPLIANAGRLEDNRLIVTFPHDNQSCRRCGSCKGERIREYRLRHGEVKAVFVGDGYSDACGAAEADIVLAKKDLEQYCVIHNIDHIRYDTFDDVSRFLTERRLLRS